MNVDTLHVYMAVFAWLVVAIGAGLAVYHPRIEDTFVERVALVLISISATGTACRVTASGIITDGGFWLACSMALYVGAVFWKHWQRNPGDNRDKGHAA